MTITRTLADTKERPQRMGRSLYYINFRSIFDEDCQLLSLKPDKGRPEEYKQYGSTSPFDLFASDLLSRKTVQLMRMASP